MSEGRIPPPGVNAGAAAGDTRNVFNGASSGQGENWLFSPLLSLLSSLSSPLLPLLSSLLFSYTLFLLMAAVRGRGAGRVVGNR